MKKSIVAVAVIATLAAVSANATIIPASAVGLNGGGNVQTAIDQIGGQVGGLGSDVSSLYQTTTAQGKAITANSKAIADVQARNVQQDKDIHDTYVLANSKYTEAAGKALEGEVRNNKADQAVKDAAQDKTIASNYKELQGEVNSRQASDEALKRNIDGNKADQAVTDAAQDTHINAVQDAAQTANDRASNLETRADVTEQNVRNVQEAAQTANDRATGLETRADATEATDRAQDAAIATKVDTATFTADQQRQDKALSDTVTNQAATDAKQTKDLKGYADTKATSAYTASVQHTDAKVARADADRAAGDAALNTRIEQEQSNRATQDRVITDRVRKEEVNRAAGDADLQNQVNDRVTTSTFNQRSAVVDQRFADTSARIQQHKADQDKVNQAVAGTLKNHEGRITSLEHDQQQSNANWKSLKNQMDKNDKKAMAGVSSALAAASVPQVMEAGEFGVGAGAGTYGGENALAVGASYAPRSNVVLKLNVTTDSAHNFGAGAGVMVSFH